jgi:hypothetical protein
MEIEESSFLEIDRWPKEEWAASVTDPDSSVKVIRENGRVAAAINYYGSSCPRVGKNSMKNDMLSTENRLF